MAKEKKSSLYENRDFENKRERIEDQILFSVSDEELPDFPLNKPAPTKYLIRLTLFSQGHSLAMIEGTERHNTYSRTYCVPWLVL